MYSLFVDKTGDRYLAHDHRIRGMSTSDIVTAVAEMNAGKALTDGRNRKLFLDRAASVVGGRNYLRIFSTSARSRDRNLRICC